MSGSEEQGVVTPDMGGSATRLGSEPLLTHNPGSADYTSKQYFREVLQEAKGLESRGLRSSGSHLRDDLSTPDPESLADPVPAPKSPWRTATILLSEHSGKTVSALLLLSSQSVQHLAIVSVQ